MITGYTEQGRVLVKVYAGERSIMMTGYKSIITGIQVKHKTVVLWLKVNTSIGHMGSRIFIS